MTDSPGKPSSSVVTELEQSDQLDSSASDSNHPDAPIRGTSQIEIEDTEAPTVRFIQEEGPWKHWKWVPYPLRRFGIAAVKWSRGPVSPQPHRIKPFFPQVQHAPIWLMEKYLPNKKHRRWLFMGSFVLWVLTFCLVYRQGLKATELAIYGEPTDIGCGSTYWLSGNQCDINGNACRPFDNSAFAFKCPASCSAYHVLNYRAVGDQEVIYTQLIVGGPTDSSNTTVPIYRGDSFICGAAIHAGVISDATGGCGVVKLIGKQSNFVSSTRNGITTTGFDSYFPLSFTFETDIQCSSRDIRWPLLAVSVTFTAVLSLFTTSAPAFFFFSFIVMFWQTGMATDAPFTSPIPDLFSNILGKFLPAMFCAWVFYDKMGVRRTLQGLNAQIEKTVLWLGGCWVGALTNYTFDFIPIQRLTGHDLQQQPGAKAALAFIIILLAAVFGTQVWFFRQEGRLIKYLKLYALFVLGIIVCLVIPNLSFRLHHYVLALLLLPGTSMQTRPCLLYQGILVGLFIDGIARWDFESILETSAALQGDAQLDSPLPAILTPIVALAANTTSLSSITFQWQSPPAQQYDGISILVNDVERFRTYFDSDGEASFTWTRNSTLDLKEYFRFAWMEGSSTMDYTRAGIWDAEGSWTDMPAGASRVKARSLDAAARSFLE
ncbi:hypothetical protein BX600DRAFT_487931 [Xylariales sp. PMI_506]|nr:hypothetical protein BX600DRAFT_487931 [Xylariales sp. PMI_506]